MHVQRPISAGCCRSRTHIFAGTVASSCGGDLRPSRPGAAAPGGSAERARRRPDHHRDRPRGAAATARAAALAVAWTTRHRRPPAASSRSGSTRGARLVRRQARGRRRQPPPTRRRHPEPAAGHGLPRRRRLPRRPPASAPSRPSAVSSGSFDVAAGFGHHRDRPRGAAATPRAAPSPVSLDDRHARPPSGEFAVWVDTGARLVRRQARGRRRQRHLRRRASP